MLLTFLKNVVRKVRKVYRKIFLKSSLKVSSTLSNSKEKYREELLSVSHPKLAWRVTPLLGGKFKAEYTLYKNDLLVYWSSLGIYDTEEEAMKILKEHKFSYISLYVQDFLEEVFEETRVVREL